MNKQRVLARSLAREMTREEMSEIDGAGPTRACICPNGVITDFSFEHGYICDNDGYH